MIVSLSQVQIFIIALTRVLAILIHIPILGSNSIPSQVRIAIGVVLTIVLVPWQPLPENAELLGLFPLVIAIFRELVIGTMAGMAATMTFGAFQATGEMIGFSTGFGSARVFNPALGEGGSVVDLLFAMLSLLIFMTINGHHMLIAAIGKTFEILPLNTALPAFSMERLLRLFVDLVAIGIQLSLPVVGALLLTDITLGLLAKVAPQVQVFFLGLPLKIAIGLFGLSMLLSVIYPKMIQLVENIGPEMLSLLGA